MNIIDLIGKKNI